MEVDIPRLEASGGSMNDNADPDLDATARVLDKLGDFCGITLESHYFIREELAAKLNDMLPDKTISFTADELPIKYTGFHGVRLMWPAELLAEEIKLQDRRKANRSQRRKRAKADRKKRAKGIYNFRPIG